MAHRTLGLVALARGTFVDALHHLHEALATFTGIQARYEVGRTYLALAELARAQGCREVLTTHLHEAHHLFKTLHLPTYIERTKHVAKVSDVPLAVQPAR